VWDQDRSGSPCDHKGGLHEELCKHSVEARWPKNKLLEIADSMLVKLRTKEGIAISMQKGTLNFPTIELKQRFSIISFDPVKAINAPTFSYL